MSKSTNVFIGAMSAGFILGENNKDFDALPVLPKKILVH